MGGGMTRSRRRASRSRRATLRVLAAGAVAGIVVLLPVGLASAKTKTTSSPVGVTFTGGCKGKGSALRSNGKLLDKATAPEAPGATTADPFKVARGGTVDWAGSTPVVFTDHSWFIHVDGFPISSGGSQNASHEKSASGVVKVSSYLPSWLGVTGVYYVNGEISGVGGTCTGAVFVEFTGDPATGLLMWVGIVFVLGGIALLLGSRPTWLTGLRAVPKVSAAPTYRAAVGMTQGPGSGATAGGGAP